MTVQQTLCPTSAEYADSYEKSVLLPLLQKEAQAIGLTPGCFCGKKVVIKPNLIAPMKPDAAATTHPVFLEAVVELLREYGADDLMLAESPGGLFSEATLRTIYKNTGIAEAAQRLNLTLNYDTSAETLHCPDAAVCHSFHVITPIAQADVIVNLCKLKSHTLTRLSCAVKNLFGVIPGIEKFEMHSAYPEVPSFANMLIDLYSMLSETKEILSICDGIVAMEGNGPTGGTPRKLGTVLMSRSAFSLDLAAEEIIGFSGTTPITETARKRGIVPPAGTLPEILGTPLDSLKVSDFREPDASRGKFLRNLPNMFGGRLAKFCSPRPQIDLKNCIGCGKCAESCPRHVIEIKETKRGKRAVIDRSDCIRCFCCQELCPIHAVKIQKNPIFLLIH